MKNTFEFKLYEVNQASDDSLDKYNVSGVNGMRSKTFEGLNVYQEYQCGVRVKVSNGFWTETKFESKFTKRPKEIKPHIP